MANLKYFLWLTTRKGFQPGEAAALLDHFGTPEAAYFAEREEYGLLGLSPVKQDALLDKELNGAEEILAACARLNIHIMTVQDADYPELLGQIYDPPAVLYWKGRPLPADGALAIGVVGTRKCTPYGEVLAGKLGLELARNGAAVVSGMAEGIDSAALKGALQGGGKVISVLGCGLDVVYPKSNRRLYEDVAAAGTLLSEYPPGTEPAGHHFPIRNRILSGLTLGAVVVEAPEPSGALITARRALEQDREVFAFPGPVNAPQSLGCNRLIQRGEAKLVLSAADILEEFSGRLPHQVLRPSPLDEETALERLTALKLERKEPPAAEKVVDKEPGRAYISLSDDPEAFTDDERDILMVLEKRALTADDIAEAAQIPARRVLSALTMLQLRSLVEERPGKRFYAAVILKP